MSDEHVQYLCIGKMFSHWNSSRYIRDKHHSDISCKEFVRW